MAKAIGIGSQYAGKLGNTVGYQIRNRYGRKQQAVRTLALTHTDKQSYRQCQQRIKLAPVQKFAAAAREVVSRSYEGIPYGSLSSREFVRQNLTRFAGPYVIKGYADWLPGPYLMSRGTLPEVKVLSIATMSRMIMEVRKYYSQVIFDVIVSEDEPLTGHDLLQNNIYLSEGDQLTAVLVINREGARFVKTESFFILDNSDILPGIWSKSDSASENGEVFNLMVSLSDNPDNSIVEAACMIVSRPNGQRGYLRSTATLTLSQSQNFWFTDEAFNSAVRSYAEPGNINSNWPVIGNDPELEFYSLCIMQTTQLMYKDTPNTAPAGLWVLGIIDAAGLQRPLTGIDDASPRRYFLRPDGQPYNYTSNGTTKRLYISDSYEYDVPYNYKYGHY